MRFCPRCRQSAPPASRFCSACGSPLTVTGSGVHRFLPWIFAGAVGVVLLALILQPGTPPPPGDATPAPAAPPTGTPPDLSALSPAERFDRLYQRIIAAAQSGDQTTVTRFMPMAVGAFEMLDSVTVDARYHMAMLHLHVGNLPAAASQADSIKRTDPEHLFGFVVDAALARWNKDDAARNAAYREFLKRYEAEMATRRPEYTEHRAMLEELHRTATGEGTRATPKPGG